MVSRFARKSGMLDMVTLTVESGGIGGFPVSGEAFGAMIGAASVYDMANQFDLYDNGGLDVCFMGALEVHKEGKGIVEIEKEGSISKFVDRVKSISFSARRAIANGQKVLYVTERCVFRLTPKGLKLIEVYPGIDVQKDILDLLPFEVEV